MNQRANDTQTPGVRERSQELRSAFRRFVKRIERHHGLAAAWQ
ncbi:MAG: hypothetical protein ACLQT5_09110 [Steroidobacteraceae bacterium]